MCCRRPAAGKQLSTGQLHLMVRIFQKKMKTERVFTLSVFMVRVSRFELEAS